MNQVLSKDIRVRLATVAPLGFMFATIFLFRFDIGLFYLLVAGLIVSVIYFLRGLKLPAIKLVAYGIIVLASIGIVASTLLTLEKIELLADPNRVTSCSISPIVSCSPVIGSKQAAAFSGIPNPIFGLFGFACFLAAGMGLLSGAKYNKQFWLTMLAGTVAGSLFSIWLLHVALYVIGALCLYCMSVWFVSFSLFWVVLGHNLRAGYIVIPKKAHAYFQDNVGALITYSIAIVILLIFFRWSDYWISLF